MAKQRGFPSLWSPWCNGDLKRKPMQNYRASQSEPLYEYVGIAADEPKRLERLLKKPNISAPLADYNITENKALEICRAAYLLSPIYATHKRNGCWFCHNARLDEMRDLWRNYPELWEELRKLQTISPIKFTSRNSIFDLEERFKKEEAQ